MTDDPASYTLRFQWRRTWYVPTYRNAGLRYRAQKLGWGDVPTEYDGRAYFLRSSAVKRAEDLNWNLP